MSHIRIVALAAMASLWTLTACSQRAVSVRPADEWVEVLRFDQPVAAAIWRYQQRLNEDGTVPPGALMAAKRHRDAMVAAQGQGASGGADALPWTWLGPGNIGGRLRAVLIHPTQPEIICVGSASGGIWKTSNAGGSWAPLDDFMPTLAIGSMAMDPFDSDVLYAGTGEGFFESVEGTSNLAAVRGAGIFKSTDAGLTWNQMPSTDNPDFYFVNRIAIHPADPLTMLVATTTGLFRTTDGGATWEQRRSGGFFDVKFDPGDPMNAVAGRRDARPLFSRDGGVTWNGAAGINGERTELAYAPSNTAIVYGTVSTSGAITIYRSEDGGESFTLRFGGSSIRTLSRYNNIVWVDPTNPETILIGGVQLFRSIDGGQTVSQVFNSVHADHHAIVHHPGYDGVTNRTVFFGNDGGIHRTADALGNSAVELNNNLGVTQFYGAAVSPSGAVIGGTQDNGTLLFTGGTETWASVIGGDGGFCAADPTDPNVLYGETQRLIIRRSVNGGQSFQNIAAGIGDAGGLNVNFIPYFMLDPNDANRMLAAGRRLWRSNNVKASPPSWSAIKPPVESPDPPPPPNPDHFNIDDPRNISTIAVADGNSDIVWVGHNNGQIYKTVNGTAAQPDWTRVDDNGEGVPDRWISRIVIDRNNHDLVYVSVMGWADGNVVRTADGGQTWTDVTGSGFTGLPLAPVASLAVHRARPGRIFAGTDLGLFTSNDDGQNWSPATQGPGTAAIDELLWSDDDTLVAVTHGRGVFMADVSLALNLQLVAAPLDPTSAGAAPLVRVRISSGTQNPVPGSAEVSYRDDGGAFVAIQLMNIAGDLYEAVLPMAMCATAPQFFVRVLGNGGAEVTLPADAPASLFSYRVGQLVSLFADNFEDDNGWTAENLGATSGDWQRGVPVDDPNWDFDPVSDSDGSGKCYLTQNEFGNTDVDDGAVRLTSPLLDMSGDDPSLRYDYYLNLTNPAGTDRLLVEISANDVAGPWVEVTRHETDGALSWRSHEITAADIMNAGVPLTAIMRLRYTANDADPQSIVEGGLDAFSLNGLVCGGCEPCDANCDGMIDAFDIEPFIALLLNPLPAPCSVCAADVNGDGAVDAFDIEPFIQCLVGP